VPIIGGISEAKQQRLLKRSPDIIVATPGRLWDLLEKSGGAGSGSEMSGEEDTNTRQVFDLRAQLLGIRALIIDECDRMFERAHFKQLTQLLAILNEEYFFASLQLHCFI
jgi:ATP-dependent RNA helicase DDX24/MAK5